MGAKRSKNTGNFSRMYSIGGGRLIYLNSQSCLMIVSFLPLIIENMNFVVVNQVEVRYLMLICSFHNMLMKFIIELCFILWQLFMSKLFCMDSMDTLIIINLCLISLNF